MKIHGAQMPAKRLSRSKPRMAKSVMTAPMDAVVSTHPTPVGKKSVSSGVAIPKASPKAVAATAIIAPARMQ